MSPSRFLILAIATFCLCIVGSDSLNFATAEKANSSLSSEHSQILAQNDLYNPPRHDVRLVVVSDLNGAYGSTDYAPAVDKGMELIPYWQPDMVICSGDMVAG